MNGELVFVSKEKLSVATLQENITALLEISNISSEVLGPVSPSSSYDEIRTGPFLCMLAE